MRLLAIQALSVRGLWLHGARTLFGCGRRCRLRSRWALENGRVLDERLRHSVAGIVRRTVVLALGIRRVIVGERGRIALLRTLTSAGLPLAAALRRRRMLLRGLSVRRRKTGCSMRLLATRQTLDIVVEDIAVTEAGGTRVRVVETSLGLAVSVVLTSKIAKMRALPLMLHLAELPERAVRAVLSLPCRWCGGVEVRGLGLTEVVRWTTEVLPLSRLLLLLLLLLRDRCTVLLLLRLDLVEMSWETVLTVRVVSLGLWLLRLVTGERRL